MFPVELSKIEAFDAGFLLGLLIGEGHFGGDQKQPQITLKMHVRHLPLLQWVRKRFPYVRINGPYEHDGRHFYQMLWRGPRLQYGIMPWLESTRWSEIDPHSYQRYAAMKARYGLTDVPDYAKKVQVNAYLAADSLSESPEFQSPFETPAE